MIEKITGTGVSDRLNNTGGPSSRVRTEQIKSSFTEILSLEDETTVVSCAVPPEIIDIENWLLQEVKDLGWASIEQAEAEFSLPSEKMLVCRYGDADQNMVVNTHGLVRAVLILARCNDSFYMPGSPLILTRKRLNRSMKLITVNIKSYYELD